MDIETSLPRKPIAKQLPLFERIFGPSRSIKRNQLYLLWTMFMPLIGLFIVVRVVPIMAMLATSFTNLRLRRRQMEYIGLENFQELLEDDFFRQSLSTSTKFVLFSVILEIILGLLIAIALSRVVRFGGLYQTLFFAPYILPMVPAAIVWKWIYAPGTIGLANYLLDKVGEAPVGWLSKPDVVIKSIVIFHVWKQLGFFVIIFLVGLKAIPREYREAASCDGAGFFAQVRHIDLPLLKPVVLFGTVMGTIWAWSIFTEVYIMTKGTDASPSTDLHVIVTRIYEEGFTYDRLGYASAMSLVLFVISLVFVAIQFWLLREDEPSQEKRRLRRLTARIVK